MQVQPWERGEIAHQIEIDTSSVENSVVEETESDIEGERNSGALKRNNQVTFFPGGKKGHNSPVPIVQGPSSMSAK